MTDPTTDHERPPEIVAMHHALDLIEPITEPKERERRVGMVQARALVSIAERLAELVELTAYRTLSGSHVDETIGLDDASDEGDADPGLLATFRDVVGLVDVGTRLGIREFDDDTTVTAFTVQAVGVSEDATWIDLVAGGDAQRVWADAVADLVVETIDGRPARDVLEGAYAAAMGAALDAAVPVDDEPEPLATVHDAVDLDADVAAEPAEAEPLVHDGSFFDDAESGPDDD